MRLVLLSNDLMVVSRVEGAAARIGALVRAAAGAAKALEFHGAEPADVVIVDLAISPLGLSALVNQLKSDTSHPMRIVAFGPHVHEDRLAAARAAGCDVVMSRGQFFAQADAILAESTQSH